MARVAFNNGGMDEQKVPTFFKIIKSSSNTDYLRIPPEFRKHILNELSMRAILTPTSIDCSWSVRVREIGRNLYLKEGWQEFLRDNSLGDSEFLVFRYDGNMCFSIDIFEKTGFKRTESPGIRRDQRSMFSNTTKRPHGRPRKYSNAAEHTPNGESGIPIEQTESKFPAFKQTITLLYAVEVPTSFSKRHLPPDNYKFVLENTDGETWQVNGTRSTSSIRLCGGWVTFARCNGIELGDVCLFELHSKCKTVVHMVVYIIRTDHCEANCS